LNDFNTARFISNRDAGANLSIERRLCAAIENYVGKATLKVHGSLLNLYLIVVFA